eukprot:5735550-Lingulodinium_polyedra.AAC.1
MQEARAAEEAAQIPVPPTQGYAQEPPAPAKAPPVLPPRSHHRGVPRGAAESPGLLLTSVFEGQRAQSEGGRSRSPVREQQA